MTRVEVDFPKVLSSFFFAVRKYAGKDFSPLQRAKSTGGFFDQGVTGGVSLFQPIKSTYVK